MAQLPGWMPILLDRISWGCTTSPLFAEMAEEDRVMTVAKEICLDLLPFIKQLPDRIASVRDQLPKTMSAARSLLGELSDDELKYQALYIKQCEFAGCSEEEVSNPRLSKETEELCRVMESLCCRSSYVDGVHAIVAAELAATMFARSVTPCYETYIQKKRSHYDKTYVDEGLAWLRLHAKPHTRHAIWMIRMLGDVEDEMGNEVPEAADKVLTAILRMWHCPPEESRLLESTTSRP